MALKDTTKKDESVNYILIVLFYFLGTTCFIANTFYVTANGYWMYKFRDLNVPFNNSDSDTQKTNLQKNFTAYTSIASYSCRVIFLLVTFFLVTKISLAKRIIGGMVLLLTFFAITLFFVYFSTDSWQKTFFFIAIGIAGLLSSGSSILLVSLFQLASRFPTRCLAAQVAGESLCGIISASVQVIALLVVSSVQNIAGLYYSVAIMVIGGTMIAFVVVSNNSEYFHNKLKWKTELDKQPAETTPIFDIAMLKTLLKKIWSVLACFVVSLVTTHVLHPGVTTLIDSSGKGTSTWSDTYFLPVCVYLLYYTSEFIGREISNYIDKLKNFKVIFGTTVVRLALVPLILLCNLQPKKHLPVVFHDDAYFIIFMALLGLSNGYVQNAIIIILPQ